MLDARNEFKRVGMTYLSFFAALPLFPLLGPLQLLDRLGPRVPSSVYIQALKQSSGDGR